MLLGICSSVYFTIIITKLDMVPTKYYIIVVGLLVILNILGIIGLFGKKLISKIFGIIILLVVTILSIIGINYGDDTLNFLNKAFNNNGLEVTGYSVAVLKSSDYDKLDDLDGKTMGYLKMDEEKSKFLAILKSKISCEVISYDDIYSLYENLLDKKIDSIIIDEAYLDMLEDEYDDIDDRIKVIYNFEIETLVEKKNNNIDKLEPINILISGSDSRSGKIVTKTRSDVNMIMTINPKDHTILLTSIPRDYYVRLHGTTGNKDKLTHAGIYGINMTKQTLEDVLDIKIDYTIKVGFNSVIELVDLIGGIDIDSDSEFISHCGDGGAKRVKVVKGMNHFTGAEALSYARERYAYKEGDVHRVQNQQQVLEAVITKISKDKSILSKYDKLLESFSELYRTDIPEKYIKLIVKEQLDSMKSWKIEKQFVTGTGAREETYSMPGRSLYVMIPDQESINSAREKINKYLGKE